MKSREVIKLKSICRKSIVKLKVRNVEPIHPEAICISP